MGDDDWMEGLSWPQRMALKLGRGGVVDFMKKLFVNRPGLLRTVLAAYVLGLAVLHVLGLGQYAAWLTSIATWIGVSPENAGAPFSTEAVIAGVLAFAALLRPVVRWFLPEKDPAKA